MNAGSINERMKNSPTEIARCHPEPGKDAFHRVPIPQKQGRGGTRPYHSRLLQTDRASVIAAAGWIGDLPGIEMDYL
jgi:hypothetical protein